MWTVRASGQSMAKSYMSWRCNRSNKSEKLKEFFFLGEIYAIVTIDNFRMIKIVTKENDNYYTLISKPTDSKKMNFQTNKKKIPYYQCSKFRHLAIYFKIHKL
jgi:hypothetical protein